MRWRERFCNFSRALKQLDGFIEPPELNNREQQCLIKPLECCFELGWHTLRYQLRSQDDATLLGSRDTL